MNYIIRFAIALLTLLLFSCTNSNKTALSQPKNDSIRKYLELASNDTLSFPDRNKYNKKAFSFIDLSKNDTLTRYYLFQISVNYSSSFNKKKYLKISSCHFEKSKKANDTLNLARYYRYRAAYFNKLSVFDSSYFYCLKSEKLYRKTNDKFGLAKVYLCKGGVLYSVNNYLEAELWFNKALSLLKKTKYKDRLVLTYLNLGLVEFQLGNYDSSIKYYKVGLKIIDDNKVKTNEVNKAYIYLNMGYLYDKKRDYKKSRIFFKLANNCKNIKRDNPNLYISILENLAQNSMNNNNFNGLPKQFFKILNSSLINDYNVPFNCRMDLSNFFLKIKDTINAQKYANEALLVARKSKVPYNILNGLRQVGYTNKNRAQQCIDEYDKKIDSLLIADRKTRNQFYKIQLDVDEITQEKDNAIIQKWVIVSMMSGILLIVILLFVIFYQKSKQKEVKLLQAQQKANEETYQMFINQQALQDEAKTIEKKRIALELHDNILNKLASIRFNLYPITQKNDPEIQKNAEKHVNRIKDVEDEIRTISHDFSNDLFAEAYSFKIILEKLIDEQNKLYPDTQYRIELEEKINLDSVSSKIKMNMYRIIQEALYNVHKHAKATKVAVAIIQDENNICISILDNGIGFDTSKTKEGIGIKNIKLRIKQLSGKISVISSTKHGTAINMAIPIVTINK
jgi:signal transduction histidine kinase